MQCVTADEAVTLIIANVQSIRGEPAEDAALMMYANKFVGFVLDYCNRVVESAKQQIIESLSSEGLTAIEAIADKFVTQVQAQAASEEGWNAIRDKFVLPLLINGAIGLAKMVISKSTTAKNN